MSSNISRTIAFLAALALVAFLAVGGRVPLSAVSDLKHSSAREGVAGSRLEKRQTCTINGVQGLVCGLTCVDTATDVG